MQVPDSLYGKQSIQDVGRRKDGDRVPPKDDSFRKILTRERSQVKNVDDETKRKTPHEEVEDSEVSEDEEFSIFNHPKRPTKAPQQQTARTIRDDVVEEVDVEEDTDQFLAQNDPNTAALAKGKAPTAEEMAIITPDHEQEKLDQARQSGAPVFVEKKDKPADNPNLAKAKSTKGEQTQQTQSLTKSQETEEPQTPSKDLVQGKAAIKEQANASQRDIALPGSKEETGKFEKVLEKQAPDVRTLTGETDKQVKPETSKRVESPKAKETPHEGEHVQPDSTKDVKQKAPAADDEPIDPRTVAFQSAMDKDSHLAIKTEEMPQRPPLAQKLKEIVDQIVKEIYTLSDSGKTETTITLHHPPLFDGAVVKIETFKSAPNQLNITFSNLTGPGKRLLDENIASLKTALERNERGYIVQQLHTTTLEEVPRYVADAQQPQKERDQDADQQQKRQRQDEEEAGPDKKRRVK